MTTAIYLELEDDMNQRLEQLARKNRRSKRMEATVAIETYLDENLPEPKEAQREHELQP